MEGYLILSIGQAGVIANVIEADSKEEAQEKADNNRLNSSDTVFVFDIEEAQEIQQEISDSLQHYKG